MPWPHLCQPMPDLAASMVEYITGFIPAPYCESGFPKLMMEKRYSVAGRMRCTLDRSGGQVETAEKDEKAKVLMSRVNAKPMHCNGTWPCEQIQ